MSALGRAGGSTIRAQRSGMESYHCVFYYFVFTRKPAQCKENGRRQHMASGYQCVSHSNETVRLRTLQSSRWKSGLKCRQPLGGLGRIKLRIRISLDSTWDSCPRFPELLSSAGLGSLQAKLQSDCHEGVAPSAKQAGRSTGRQRICRGTGR